MDEDEEANEWLLVVEDFVENFLRPLLHPLLPDAVRDRVRATRKHKGAVVEPEADHGQGGGNGHAIVRHRKPGRETKLVFRLNEQTAPAGDQLYPSVAPHSVPSVRA